LITKATLPGGAIGDWVQNTGHYRQRTVKNVLDSDGTARTPILDMSLAP